MNLSEVKKPQLYSMVEVAKQMEIGYATLYRMVKNGRIKALNIAKSGTKPIFAFRAEDVQAYYDSLPHSDQQSKKIH